jgi:signal transduction histidine kinase
MSIHNVERALSQVKRLENLTRNLLHLSKVESDIESSSVILIDAVDIMTGVAQFHASQAEQADINIVLDASEAKLMVKANAEQLQQALANLLHNAIKFTGANGEVRISVQGIQDDVRFSIDDTGIGIPETDLPFLFNRFHRGRNATRHEGNGLGLAIVETIVKRYGGMVIAENTVHGARFSVILPQAKNA